MQEERYRSGHLLSPTLIDEGRRVSECYMMTYKDDLESCWNCSVFQVEWVITLIKRLALELQQIPTDWHCRPYSSILSSSHPLIVLCFQPFLWTPAQRKRATMLYFVNVFFKFFLWPPYSPALVNGGSRKFYTWWTLSVIREVTTWVFSWSSLNYRVGQTVTKFAMFSDPTSKLSAVPPELRS